LESWRAKKVIKAENPRTFANVDAKDIKLWNVTIPDDRDDLLSSLSLNDEDELLVTREIGDYWSGKPPKKSVHVIVEPPVSTVSSNEVLKLREEVASLKEKLSKSEYGMCKVVGNGGEAS
jgi:hypothetical protein